MRQSIRVQNSILSWKHSFLQGRVRKLHSTALVTRGIGDLCKIWYDGNSALLSGVYYRHKRPKLGVDPEAVLLKSGLESSTAAAFLHENMLEFVDHDAVEDAAGACSYLSDAGLH